MPTLYRWQKRFFRWTVDIYRPAAPAVDVNKKRVPRSYPAFGTPTELAVPCLYVGTEDFEELAGGMGLPAILGQISINNIMTQDRFFMHSLVDVSTDYKLVLTGPAGHPLLGNVWIVQGETKTVQGTGRQFGRLNTQLVYAKRSEEKTP